MGGRVSKNQNHHFSKMLQTFALLKIHGVQQQHQASEGIRSPVLTSYLSVVHVCVPHVIEHSSVPDSASPGACCSIQGDIL